MPTIDPGWVNLAILAIFGVGGSVLVFRYIGPILSTQEKHRVSQDVEIAKLRVEVKAAERERELLKELVTQRAQVDDLRQYAQNSVTEGRATQKAMLDVVERHSRENADQHQQLTLALREIVSALRNINVSAQH